MAKDDLGSLERRLAREAMFGRRAGKSQLAAAVRDFELACGRSVRVASPGADGGVHICTIHPFRRRR